jgi:histidine triad (HIT) family protein
VIDCVFCGIAAGTEPATIVREWTESVAFVPRNPVCAGHVLVIPREHVIDAIERPFVTAVTMMNAVQLASEYSSSNILTSVGVPATQSVFHLHIHVVPRFVGDQLMLPWGTTDDPHEPHRCKGMDRLEAELSARAAR